MKPKQIPERAAEGELENVYHDIKQTLRVSGINLIFRIWAGQKNFLPELWRSFRPNAETRAFEEMADRLRADSVRAAAAVGRLQAAESAPLGDSQAFQLDAALDLYHYINPKLLLMASAAVMALEGQAIGRGADGAGVERIERGIPARMYPMEMVSEKPDDKALRDLFEDIKQTLSLQSINSDYRTLALWPTYLFVLWSRLAPFVKRPEYERATRVLREASREYVRALPFTFQMQSSRIEESLDNVFETSRNFERLLPALILNISLAQADRHSLERCLASPFPAASRSLEPVEVLV